MFRLPKTMDYRVVYTCKDKGEKLTVYGIWYTFNNSV